MKIIPAAEIKDSGSFTRATEAGQWNSVGNWESVAPNVPRFSYDPMDLDKPPILLLEREGFNHLVSSENLDSTAWAKPGCLIFSNNTISPRGEMNADKLVAQPLLMTHYIEQNQDASLAPLLLNKTYTRSWHIKAAEMSKVRFDIFSRPTSSISVAVIFDAATGQFSFPSTQGGASQVLKAEQLPNGWWRVSQTFSLNSPDAEVFCRLALIDQTSNATSFTGDGNSGIYVWGTQLEEGSSASSYFATNPTFVSRGSVGYFYGADLSLQSAIAELPRMGYDPKSPGGLPRLLVEWGATNFIRNNTMVGAQNSAVASPWGSLPSNWNVDLSTNQRCEITDVQFDSAGYAYIDARFSSTSNDRAYTALYFEPSNGTGIIRGAGLVGQFWAGSAFFKNIGGTSASNNMLYIRALNSSGAETGAYGAQFVPAGSNEPLARGRVSVITPGMPANSDRLTMFYIAQNLPIGGQYDFTIRIGLPQLEFNETTTPIKTNNGGLNPQRFNEYASYPQTRAADVSDIGLITLLKEDEAPYYSPRTVYALGDRIIELSDHKIYESGMGTRFTTASISIATPGLVTIANHGLVLNTPVVFETSVLPVGLIPDTVYYVVNPLVNTFSVSATKGGTAIATSGTPVVDVSIVANGNYGRAAPDEDIWIDTGSSNKWAFLDQSIESQTVAQDVLCAGLRTPAGELIDSVVIQNVDGASHVRVALITIDEGVVYDRVVNMSSAQDIRDPYSYTFEPIERDTDLVLSGLPPYADAYVSVTMLGRGSVVKCGLNVIGRAKNFGPTQAGMSLGMLDYSKKEKNDYGNTKVVEGAFSGTMNLTCFVDRAKMNQLIKMLVGLRATPAVYIGDDALTCSVQYGYYNDYTMGADYVEHSVLHIEIESLT